MGWIGCVRCQKLQCELMARVYELIAPVQPVLHEFRVVMEHCQWIQTLKTHQIMSLGSNGVDRVRSLPKITMRVHGTNFWINCTSSALLHWVSCSNETLPNAPNHYEMHQIMSFGSDGVDRVRSLQKIKMRVHGTNFWINCTSSARFALSSLP